MRILIASAVAPQAIEQLQAAHEVKCAFGPPPEKLAEMIADCQVLIFRSGVHIDRRVLDAAGSLALIIRAGSGTDNIDLEEVSRRGIQFHRIPGPGARAVAELSFALMLALARNLFKADRLLRQGYWAKYQLEGFLLKDKTLGIIGAGNIGSLVGEMGAAWGMAVIGCAEEITPQISAELAAKNIRLTTFDEVITRADFLSIHVPLTAATRHLINADVLGKVKPGSFLVNLARGGVVDEQALFHALSEGGRLRGAALDVHETEGPGKISPLATLPNVILTPHIGAQTVDSQEQIGRRIVQIVNNFSTAESARASGKAGWQSPS